MDTQKEEVVTVNTKKHPAMERVKQYTSTITGTKYTFQKVDAMTWLDMMDEVEASKENTRRTLYPKVLDNIVVQPRMTIEDFTIEKGGSAELEEVVTAAVRFQRGK